MCYNPVILSDRDYQPVPCGKCYECRRRLVHSWAFRIMEEEKRCVTSNFITLTYDTTNVPVTRSGRLSVYKRDVQLFFKRLRKAHTKSGEVSPIKYFLCSEYGGRTKRPHYHIVLFNAGIEAIECAWRLGSIHYGSVCVESVYYVAKYMMKNDDKSLRRVRDSVSPKKIWSPHKEFRLMSKGLGETYCKKSSLLDWHKADVESRCYLNLLDGKKIAMPRYYKDKIYNEEQREIVSYAGLLKAREKAEKDKLNPEKKRERYLAGLLVMDLNRLSRSKV